jgi:hypothetical protein
LAAVDNGLVHRTEMIRLSYIGRSKASEIGLPCPTYSSSTLSYLESQLFGWRNRGEEAHACVLEKPAVLGELFDQMMLGEGFLWHGAGHRHLTTSVGLERGGPTKRVGSRSPEFRHAGFEFRKTTGFYFICLSVME